MRRFSGSSGWKRQKQSSDDLAHRIFECFAEILACRAALKTVDVNREQVHEHETCGDEAPLCCLIRQKMQTGAQQRQGSRKSARRVTAEPTELRVRIAQKILAKKAGIAEITILADHRKLGNEYHIGNRAMIGKAPRRSRSIQHFQAMPVHLFHPEIKDSLDKPFSRAEMILDRMVVLLACLCGDPTERDPIYPVARDQGFADKDYPRPAIQALKRQFMRRVQAALQSLPGIPKLWLSAKPRQRFDLG